MAESKTGNLGVILDQTSQSKPYQAHAWRGEKMVHLGSFATAEEAALCVARSPQGQAAAQAQKTAAAPVPLTSEEAWQQAQVEGLTLRMAKNTTGYFDVHLANPGQPKPYQAVVRRGGQMVNLGSFATAGQAALCVARSLEGRKAAVAEAAEKVAVAPLTGEEARQQAQAEGLALRVVDSKTGYFVWRGGKIVSLGCFATAEETALCVARSPEGQAAARRAASAETT